MESSRCKLFVSHILWHRCGTVTCLSRLKRVDCAQLLLFSLPFPLPTFSVTHSPKILLLMLSNLCFGDFCFWESPILLRSFFLCYQTCVFGIFLVFHFMSYTVHSTSVNCYYLTTKVEFWWPA